MQNRQDITMHSDEELSLLVFNDETLYRMRRLQTRLIHELNELYIFTEAQLDVLKQDLQDDADEDSQTETKGA